MFMFHENGGVVRRSTITGRVDLITNGVIALSSCLVDAATGLNEVVAIALKRGYTTAKDWQGYGDPAGGDISATIQVAVDEKRTLLYNSSPLTDEQEALLAAAEASRFLDHSSYRDNLLELGTNPKADEVTTSMVTEEVARIGGI